MKWAPVTGYEGRYSVSDAGNVISLNFAKSKEPRALSINLRKPGHKGKWVCIHRLVMESFVGGCPKGKNVNHKDGDKLNNNLKNLEYVTPSENSKHSFRIGKQCNKGERHSQHKLTEENVRAIRKLLKDGVKQAVIAKRFSVCQGNIAHIKRGKLWAHVI
jgi:hypothetical protein